MLYSPTDFENNIIITRVRLARNIKNYPFYIKDDFVSREIIKKIFYSLKSVSDKSVLYLKNMSDIQLGVLKEKHIISQALSDNKDKSAIILSKDESISIMVHEEDIIREQCFLRGLNLFEAYRILDKIDTDISKNIDFAFDENLGYLTACPTNVGTGLRASVMLFLPALTESGKIKEIILKTEKLGFTIRGIYGEGSKAEGFNYQISNEVTLGVTEEEILSGVNEMALTICKAEAIEEEMFYKNNFILAEDKCLRAYGILNSCKILPYEEFSMLISYVKLGVCLNIFDFENSSALNDLIVSVSPMNLLSTYSKEKSQLELDISRAEFVKKSLVKIKGAK